MIPALTSEPASGLVDADNHYYEPDDCFTRYIEAAFEDKAVNIRRGEDGLGRVFLGDRRANFLSVTQTDFIGAPGALAEMIAGRQDRSSLVFEPIRPREHPEFMHRPARLALLDEQGIDACVMLPTLGLCVEHDMHDDPAALFANLRAFNRWLEEDWGYGGGGRIFGVPMLSLLDLDEAIAELERVLAVGAKLIYLRPGPVYGRSPADPHFDRFWARVEEAGVPAVFHVADSGYNDLHSTQFGEAGRMPLQRHSAFQLTTCSTERPIVDTMAALVLHNLFGRFPRLRVMSIENGSTWVEPLLYRMDKAAAASATAPWIGGPLPAAPSQLFREHVYVVPFHEDPIEHLVELIGAEHVVFGSDYPHPEGVAEPRTFVESLGALDERSVERVMGRNMAELLGIA